MKSTSIRELHIRTSELVREAERGNTIVIERRGEPVAELRPLTTKSGISLAVKDQIFSSMREIWSRMPQVSDSGPALEEDRDG